jgi:hypothetical protein
VDARYRDVLAFGQRVLGCGFHVHERHPGLIEGLRELSAFRRSNRAWQTNAVSICYPRYFTT